MICSFEFSRFNVDYTSLEIKAIRINSFWYKLLINLNTFTIQSVNKCLYLRFNYNIIYNFITYYFIYNRFVLVKERDFLLTEELRYITKNKMMPSADRIKKVSCDFYIYLPSYTM